ncbi:MAG TPA: hypothetical protein VFV72_08555 [Candidatus Limnocylindrales bacterium]|nr:hypothetical protein [Candidatus Limnocylindrales bacterium]
MTEQPQQPETDQMAASDSLPDNISSNGTHPEAAIAIAELPETEIAGPDEATTPPVDEAQTDRVTADAIGDETVAPDAETRPIQDDAAPDDGTAFLAQLARAMQETAGVERKRIDEDIERRRTAHLDTIRARRESGAASIQDLAAADLKAIDDWAQDEHQRINLERKERAAALQADLDASLAEHGAKVDAEIESVEAAIAAYRTDVDAYFATIEATTDPVEIAQHASQRPVFPDLDAVASAQNDPAPVPVMEAEAAADPATAWARWNETGQLPAVSEPGAAPETTGQARTAASQPLLQSIPAARPYGAYRESTADPD